MNARERYRTESRAVRRAARPSKPRQCNGAVIWQGLSQLDGVTPIAVIVTGLAQSSANTKTGSMLQTWIIRTDVEPHTAVRQGRDGAICGDCKHRPATGGACYVRTYQAPLAVYRAFHRGVYPIVTSLAVVASLAADRDARVGSYGDPAAAPVAVWQAYVSRARSHTGYTHQWRNPAFAAYASFCMASTDTPAERDLARSMGWRTFTVRLASDALAPRESVCPASKEAGHLTNCAACGACNGTATQRKGSIAILAHGGLARRFIAIRRAA